MESIIVALFVAVLVTAFLLSHWKRVLQLFVATILVLAIFGAFALLQGLSIYVPCQPGR